MGSLGANSGLCPMKRKLIENEASREGYGENKGLRVAAVEHKGGGNAER